MKKQAITLAICGGDLFPLGNVYATAAAVRKLSPGDVGAALARHARGDWGTVNEEDWESNELALEQDGRLFSTYLSKDQTVFWIITEWDRSATTILLPRDY